MMLKSKRVIALLCVIVLAAGVVFSTPARAARKPVFLSKTRITLQEGKSKVLKVKKTGRVKIRKKTFKSNNKAVATVTRKGRITAKSAGNATVKVTVKYKKGKRVKTGVLKCQVMVMARKKVQQPNVPKTHQTPVVSPSTSPEPSPSGTPVATVDLTISSARELNEFAQKVNTGNHYSGKLIQLTQDIEFDGVTVNNYTPIAVKSSREFEGTFDGCGHTISGIDVTDTTDQYDGVALFGYIGEIGTVKNLTVSDSSFTGDAGGCIAYSNRGTINNCHNRRVSAYAGIAYKNYGTIMNCSSASDITSGNYYVGGIARSNGTSGEILNCCNLGNVYCTNDYFEGVGGIAGENDGTLQNCFNTGVITCSGSRPYIGGISGVNTYTAIVANSYCSVESAEQNFGTMKGEEKNCKSLPLSDMQAESFVSLLNNNRGSNTEWLDWGIQADGSILYPVPGIALLSGAAGDVGGGATDNAQ